MPFVSFRRLARRFSRDALLLESLESRTLLNALYFAGPAPIPVGQRPQSVAAADLNHDGKPDLVVANEISDTINIFLGNGDGTFQIHRTFSLGNQPDSVVIADVNGDGIPDIVVSTYTDSTVTVLLGNGRGGFPKRIVTPVVGLTHGATPIALAADITGSGRMDLVTANGLDGSVSVYPGNGDGTFAAPITTPIAGIESDAFSVAVGEFDGTAVPDIVVTNPSDSVIEVLSGNGDGHFKAPVSYTTGSYPSAVAIADLNGDGKQDLVVTNKYSGTDAVLLGNGNGTFAPAASFAAGSLPFATAVADLNGDGIPDLIAVNSGNSYAVNHTVSVLVGNGDGTFQSPIPLTVGNYPIAVAVADFNGDGNPDLVTANAEDNTLAVLLNTGPRIRFENGALTIRGTEFDDAASLTFADGNITARIDDAEKSIPRDQIKSITVSLIGDNDTLAIGSGVGPVLAMGGAGADTITAGNGLDVTPDQTPDVAGQIGSVTISVPFLIPFDTIKGGHGPDSISSTTDGNNRLDGGRGADTLVAGQGNDTLIGNFGRDSLVGSGADTVGGGGVATFTPGANTLLLGGPGPDTLLAGNANDTLKGGPGNDSLIGGPGSSYLAGNSGNDTLFGFPPSDAGTDGGTDTLFGGPGDDYITDTSTGDSVSLGPA